MGDEPVAGERIQVRKRREVVIIPEELKMDGKTVKIVTMVSYKYGLVMFYKV